MSYHRSQYGNKSLSNKTLADSFYNDQLSCLISSPGWLLVTRVHRTQCHHQSDHWRSGPWKPCKVSAQKNFIVKADTLSNLFSHSNWIKQQQNWKLTNLSVQSLSSTVHRLQEVISMAPTVQSLTSSGFYPAVQPRYLLSKTVLKEVKTWNEYPFHPLCDNYRLKKD